MYGMHGVNGVQGVYNTICQLPTVVPIANFQEN